jgi:hypothetical protein
MSRFLDPQISDEFILPNDPQTVDTTKRLIQCLNNDMFATAQSTDDELKRFRMSRCNDERFELEGMAHNTPLLKHQPAAIKGIVDILAARRSASLADEVGLGKRVEICGVV